jgi:hypothetical protein
MQFLNIKIVLYGLWRVQNEMSHKRKEILTCKKKRKWKN